MKRRMNNKKKNQRMILLLIILAVTIGFAALATTLKINGFSLIGKNTWDIRWDEESVTMSEEMPADMEEEEKPKVSKSTTTDDTVSFTANLNLPGDFYEFYIDAINKGTINGEIASVTTTWKKNGEVTTLPDFLTYTVIYADNGEEPKPGDVLLKGESRTYFVRLEYNEDAEVLPEDAVIYSAEIAIDYRQGEEVTPPSSIAKGPGSEKIETKSVNPPTPIDITESDPSVTPVPDPVRISQPAVTGGESGTNPAGEDILYTSKEPNNYIYFNCDSLDQQDSEHCEMWRIIKTDSDVGDRIKIIRNEPLDEELAWNDDDTGFMTNDWANSSLKEYLNTTYYNGLKETAKKLIPTVKWYNVGGYNVIRLNEGKSFGNDHTNGMTAASAYVNERTKFVSNDQSLQRSNVMAKVGLMYASDYGYASSACYSTCTATGAHPCAYYDQHCGIYTNDYYDMNGGYNEEICRNSNWLFKSISEWTMTASFSNYKNSLWDKDDDDPYYHSDGDISDSLYCQSPTRERNFARIYLHPEDPDYYINALSIVGGATNGYIGITDVSEENYVRPVVYLKSGVDLEGTGTETDPYRIEASPEVLNGEDIYVDPTPEPDPTPSNENVLASHTNTSCSDTTSPTCELTYVNVLSNGFAFAFNCSDDVEISRITSLFDADPFHGDYDSKTFDRIGTIKNGTVINGGKTKTYSGRWTTSASHKPNRNTCYYFSYGGEDTCGNWVVYHTPSCYSF